MSRVALVLLLLALFWALGNVQLFFRVRALGRLIGVYLIPVNIWLQSQPRCAEVQNALYFLRFAFPQYSSDQHIRSYGTILFRESTHFHAAPNRFRTHKSSVHFSEQIINEIDFTLRSMQATPSDYLTISEIHLFHLLQFASKRVRRQAATSEPVLRKARTYNLPNPETVSLIHG